MQVVERHQLDGRDSVSECQCAAEDIHQDTGHDLLYDESFMEAHVPRINGDPYHWPHSEHLRHTLPGKSR